MGRDGKGGAAVHAHGAVLFLSMLFLFVMYLGKAVAVEGGGGGDAVFYCCCF